jgi:hypothetical protein
VVFRCLKEPTDAWVSGARLILARYPSRSATEKLPSQYCSAINTLAMAVMAIQHLALDPATAAATLCSGTLGSGAGASLQWSLRCVHALIEAAGDDMPPEGAYGVTEAAVSWHLDMHSPSEVDADSVRVLLHQAWPAGRLTPRVMKRLLLRVLPSCQQQAIREAFIGGLALPSVHAAPVVVQVRCTVRVHKSQRIALRYLGCRADCPLLWLSRACTCLAGHLSAWSPLVSALRLLIWPHPGTPPLSWPLLRCPVTPSLRSCYLLLLTASRRARSRLAAVGQRPENSKTQLSSACCRGCAGAFCCILFVWPLCIARPPPSPFCSRVLLSLVSFREALASAVGLAGRHGAGPTQLFDAVIAAACAEYALSRCLMLGAQADVPVSARVKDLLHRVTHPALTTLLLASCRTEANVRMVLGNQELLAHVGLPAFWHVPIPPVDVTEAEAPVADADRLCRIPFSLPVADDVHIPTDDPGLNGMLQLRHMYATVAALVKDRRTSLAQMKAWASSLPAEEQRWHARAVLLVAVYYEVFVRLGGPCACVDAALDDAEFKSALHLTPDEVLPFRFIARGPVPDPISADDGLRFLFSKGVAKSDGARGVCANWRCSVSRGAVHVLSACLRFAC